MCMTLCPVLCEVGACFFSLSGFVTRSPALSKDADRLSDLLSTLRFPVLNCSHSLI